MYKFANHIQHYVPLFTIFIVGIGAFVFFPYDRSFQIAVTIAVACGYISWGIIHHYLHGDLKAYIVAEYTAIAILGVVVIFSLLYV
jgi:hypothetical protein